ncbi:histone deacetylase family protein [Salipiger mucosus]|uniref:Acetylspermidine deacetylase, Deacetylase n=1 Tax=Salipiger mucosus DSM 16094 TaxID=1123237 RepID=S9QEY9_9RHOB|nr:histone deacetylase family protein [Salipiger mucosus]EPX78113.1 Acetylspermidine deacetylase, Deacetylase [Salipiger mucosus DSM 16094]
MTFHVYYSANASRHPARPFHPERPHRTHAALAGLADIDLPGLSFVQATHASVDAARTLHDTDYIDRLLEPIGQRPGEKKTYRVLDGGDTHQAPDSLDAALEGLGSLQDAVDRTMSGEITGALVATRPAGHHATRNQAMGFCFISQAALAAEHARSKHGARVAVLDFDVHHGNGTEDLLWDQRDVFFASTHSATLWPLTGSGESKGAHGQILNVPLQPLTGGREMRSAWTRIFSRLRKFSPDIIIVSAGFDAHMADPISNLCWKAEDFDWLARQLGEVGRDVCGGRIVSFLEGGYSLPVLYDEVPAYIAGLMGADYQRISNAGSRFGRIDGTPYVPGTFTALTHPILKFQYRKAFQRQWIQDQDNGALLYTPPDFVKLNSREPLEEIAAAASERGVLDIRDIVRLERLCG